MSEFQIKRESTREEIFKHACEVLLDDEFEQCVNEEGRCTYRAADGSNCLVGGMLRKDWLFSEYLATDDVIYEVVNQMHRDYVDLSPRDVELFEAIEPHVFLLEELQMVHDEADGSSKASRARWLYKIARKMGIKVAVYDYV